MFRAKSRVNYLLPQEIKGKISFLEKYFKRKGVSVEITKRKDIYLVKIYKHYPFFISWDKLLEIIDTLEEEDFHVTHITAGRKGIVLRCKPEFYPIEFEEFE